MPNSSVRRPAPFRVALKARRKAIRDTFDEMDRIARKRVDGTVIDFRWAALASDAKVSLHTVMHWARKGQMPVPMATALAKNYKLTPEQVDTLIPNA